ncbi:MAG TPA: type I-U CRISPR-associated RAMP protein Csb1/Cas7u, partial [Pirellulaceae bacterium]|nr:type I-U CRISPR-associated RAMP protein Csb1/Cas7u [Pirellulaceae bacterium]
MAISLQQLTEAARNAAAIRTRTTLQPAGGDGDKVFPPTYLGSKYAEEVRIDPETGAEVKCVLLDSVQSQANRMEDALQAAVDSEQISLPLLVVDFGEAELIDEVGRISSLQVPHRVADAILRDSTLGGEAFRSSEVGKRIDRVSVTNATPLFDVCPTALLFGMWDSTGPKGGL